MNAQSPSPNRPPRRRLPARYAAVVMPFVLSIMMSGVVSALSTLMAYGADPVFLTAWPKAWAVSWAVAFPTLLLVLPVVRRIVGLVVEPAGG